MLFVKGYESLETSPINPVDNDDGEGGVGSEPVILREDAVVSVR